MKDLRHEDAHHRRRAAARHRFDLEFRLRRIYITFGNESPGNLNRRQSLHQNQRSPTGRTQPGRSCRMRFQRGSKRRHCQQSAAEFEGCGTLVVGHEAEVPDADKALREYVQQEAPNELLGRDGHRALHVSVSIVPPAERHVVAVEGEQSMIGDGDARGIATQVAQHLFGAADQDTRSVRRASGFVQVGISETERACILAAATLRDSGLPSTEGSAMSKRWATTHY